MMLKARKTEKYCTILFRELFSSFENICNATADPLPRSMPFHFCPLFHCPRVSPLHFYKKPQLYALRAAKLLYISMLYLQYICKDIERITRLHLNRITAFFLHSIMFQFTLRFLFFKCVHFFCEIAFSTCYSLTPPLLAHPVYNLLYLVSNFLSSSLYI